MTTNLFAYIQQIINALKLRIASKVLKLPVIACSYFEPCIKQVKVLGHCFMMFSTGNMKICVYNMQTTFVNHLLFLFALNLHQKSMFNKYAGHFSRNFRLVIVCHSHKRLVQ